MVHHDADLELFDKRSHIRKIRNANGQSGKERLEELNEELELLNAEARELEERISENVGKFLE